MGEIPGKKGGEGRVRNLRMPGKSKIEINKIREGGLKNDIRLYQARTERCDL